ncbi:MAG: HlyD family secretion protein, partial [Methylococcales bacterium]
MHFPARLTLIALASLWLCAACDETQEDPSFQGYVEGDYLYLAAPGAGYLHALHVDRGALVAAGTVVFSIDEAPEQYELSEAEAQMISAQRKVENLKEARREPEIAAMQAELKTKEADFRYAQAQLKRMEGLIQKGFVAKADLD